MVSNNASADQRSDKEDENRLTYQGETWRVDSAPVVVDRDGEAELVEVWVRRG
jgi:hypothetical protein